MTRQSPAAVWPFVPFERYMLDDDRPGSPMTFTVIWRFAGRLDAARMHDAITRTVVSHPLLGCRAGRHAWVPAAAGVAFRRVASAAELEPDWESIDPYRDACLRVAIVEAAADAAETELRLTFHHAACDGVGAMEFSGDVFAAYRGRGGAAVSAAGARRGAPADPVLLGDRGRLDRPAVPGATWWDAASLFLGEVPRFLADGAAVIPCTTPGSGAGPTGLHPIRFDAEETMLLRRHASALGATLNELLLAMLVDTIGRHCAAASPHRRAAWLGVVQPVSMRPTRPARLPACNNIGYAFLRRPLAACRGWPRLLPGILADERAIKGMGLAACFNDAIAVLGRLPASLRRPLVRSMRPGTFVFSYLGDPVRRFPRSIPRDAAGLDLGGCHLVDFSGAPPTRPGTELAVLGSLFGQRLTLWLRPSRRLAADASFATLTSAVEATIRAGLVTQPPAAPSDAGGGAARTARCGHRA
jgi:hypothetical protein